MTDWLQAWDAWRDAHPVLAIVVVLAIGAAFVYTLRLVEIAMWRRAKRGAK